MARVLVIDDSSFMREQIKTILIELDHKVVGEAQNGKEAINQYKIVKPDLTIMDIVMPEMTGIEAVKGIREYNSDAKIIMCSSMGQKNMVVEAIKAGAIDFVIKPFNIERFKEAIMKVI